MSKPDPSNTPLQRTDSIFRPDDPDKEPTDSNPVPLSPTERARRTSDGDQEPGRGPAIFAVPAGNVGGSGTGSSAAGAAGIGAIVNPDDPQKRVSHEQPGTDSANPLPDALDRDTNRHDDGEEW